MTRMRRCTASLTHCRCVSLSIEIQRAGVCLAARPLVRLPGCKDAFADAWASCPPARPLPHWPSTRLSPSPARSESWKTGRAHFLAARKAPNARDEMKRKAPRDRGPDRSGAALHASLDCSPGETAVGWATQLFGGFGSRTVGSRASSSLDSAVETVGQQSSQRGCAEAGIVVCGS
jgi:hypothetical protein